MNPVDDATPVPRERSRTIRQQIIDCLRHGPVSIGELAAEIGLPEKQLQEHLDGLHKQVRLVIVPARCVGCGFEFTTRRRTRKPGRCPKCRGTRIQEPLFRIRSG